MPGKREQLVNGIKKIRSVYLFLNTSNSQNISVILSLKNNICTTFVPGGRRCRLKAFVHVQEGRGALKLKNLSICTLWMTPKRRPFFFIHSYLSFSSLTYYTGNIMAKLPSKNFKFPMARFFIWYSSLLECHH